MRLWTRHADLRAGIALCERSGVMHKQHGFVVVAAVLAIGCGGERFSRHASYRAQVSSSPAFAASPVMRTCGDETRQVALLLDPGADLAQIDEAEPHESAEELRARLLDESTEALSQCVGGVPLEELAELSGASPTAPDVAFTAQVLAELGLLSKGGAR